MMIENVLPRTDLLSLYRVKSKDCIFKSIASKEIESATGDGWQIVKTGKYKTKVSKPKPIDVLFEDRVWTLFYNLGIKTLSGERGARLRVSSAENSPNSQVDFVGIDEDVAICVECKTANEFKKDLRFQEKLGVLLAKKRPFAEAINADYPSEVKRNVAVVMFTWNLIVSDSDKKRAEADKIILLDEKDLAYYELLYSHIGEAAKYQILGDIFPGKQIPGLKIRVPSLQTKFGGHRCYTFAIKPEYLLKVAFVSHRSKGRGSDVTTYQRMIKKSRLKKIREYISDDGVFPTNIVLNIENSKYVRFDIGKQEGDSDGGRFGWLTLEPTYKSAWIIDGQHRLFAYSGHPRAATSYLSVVAFENMPGNVQAKLFVDINHEQKSVKRSLLDELWAELHWDSEDPEKRIRAVISKAIQGLGDNPETPFYGRILLADGEKTETACISLSSVLGALDKSGFYIINTKRDIPTYGALWGADNEAIVKRTQNVLNAWFSKIAGRSNGWWDIGAGDGGGLAMNDGVTVCINVLRSCLEHFEKSGVRLVNLSDEELTEKISPFADILGTELGNFTEGRRRDFRALRGGQGQSFGTRSCQEIIHSKMPEFDPPGLSEFITTKKAGTNDEGRKLIERIEQTIQGIILQMLKQEFKGAGDAWWFNGVPAPVRKKVDDRINESDGKHGGREQNFDIIHYKEIVRHNWDLFEQLLGYGKGGKDKKTDWFNEINILRNIVMHPSKQQYLTLDQVERLKQLDSWIQDVSNGRNSQSTDSNDCGSPITEE